MLAIELKLKMKLNICTKANDVRFTIVDNVIKTDITPLFVYVMYCSSHDFHVVVFFAIWVGQNIKCRAYKSQTTQADDTQVVDLFSQILSRRLCMCSAISV